MKVKDKDKTKEQLIEELASLRQRTAELEAAEPERKRAEDALQESESERNSILNAISDFVVFHDSSLSILWVNQAAALALGKSPEELVGQHCYQLWHGRSKPCENCPVLKSLETRSHVDGAMTTPDGRHWELVGEPVFNTAGEIIGAIEVARDITERKQAEEALTDEVTKRRILIEQSRDGIVVLDQNGKVYEANQRFAEILGYSLEEAHQLYVWDWDTQWTHEQLLEMIGSVDATGDHFETQHRRKDGTNCDVEISTNGAVFAGQKLVFCVCRDITERKRAEEALRQSEERYHDLFSDLHDAAFVADPDTGLILEANQQASILLGRSLDEIIGMHQSQLHPPEQTETYRQRFHNHAQREHAADYDGEVIRKDGTIVPVAIGASLLTIAGRSVLLGIFRDITERKQLEEERKELEQKAQMESRLATVGLLASGVGHEINNPLTGVIGYAQLLLERDIPEDIKKDLRAINEGAQRVANIVKKLVAFARYQKPQRAYAGISDIVAATADLLAHQLETSNIQTNLQLEPNLPWTMADIGQLQQVFLNIIINAETEMRLAHGKGKLSIKTEKADNTIRISFQDDGPGIAKDNLEKIFDPFFTTREVGEGTGLGLSICHEIMAEHGGRIYAQSKSGKGATFIVELPVVAEDKHPQAAKPVAEEPPKVPGARILVVDDERLILHFISQVLTDEGHEVDTVDNAEDALGKIETERYSLILLDIKLPGMSGIELYNHIEKTAQSLARRVVFITGDVMGAETTAFLSRIKAPRIDKPFDAEQLKAGVNRMLREGTS